MSDKVDFLHTDKHETVLAVDFNTFPIKGNTINIDGHGQALSKYLK